MNLSKEAKFLTASQHRLETVEGLHQRGIKFISLFADFFLFESRGLLQVHDSFDRIFSTRAATRQRNGTDRHFLTLLDENLAFPY